MSRERPTQIDVRLPAEAASARAARAELRDAAVHHLPADRLDDALVAVSEAINNVVLHAYSREKDARHVWVKIWAWHGTVEVVVADGGAGFTVGDRAAETGLGAGLRLIEALADEARVLSDQAGTVVMMRFGPKPIPQRT
jgi:anti-sigma regulatory factor (Ser/Thr protein kinase)